MVSIGFLSLPSVGVGAEAVRPAEPVVEEVRVNKQMLADANKLMADARFKGMKAVASLAGHMNDVRSVALSLDGQHIVSGSWDNSVKVWSVSGGKEVASLADTRMMFARSPSVPTGNVLFLEVLTHW